MEIATLSNFSKSWQLFSKNGHFLSNFFPNFEQLVDRPRANPSRRVRFHLAFTYPVIPRAGLLNRLTWANYIYIPTKPGMYVRRFDLLALLGGPALLSVFTVYGKFPGFLGKLPIARSSRGGLALPSYKQK